MPGSEFGVFVKERRTTLRLTLRRFAEAAGLDPGNASRMERGLVPPPEHSEVLDRIAAALELGERTADYRRLCDLAAAARGHIPEDLLSDPEVAARLPILFRTLRSKPLDGAQLEKLIDAIRKA
jgi:transcriptional regulator with XRE-family HTH domain